MSDTNPIHDSQSTSLLLAEVKGEWDAFQELCQGLSGLVEQMEDVAMTASQIYQAFGVTRTNLKEMAATGRVRRLRHKGRRIRYVVKEVLLDVLNSGAGRIRRRRRQASAARTTA